METLQSIYHTNAVPGSRASKTAPAEFQADAAVLAGDNAQFAQGMGVPEWAIVHKTGEFCGSDTEATLDSQYIHGAGLGNEQVRVGGCGSTAGSTVG